ncbi:microtubule-associated tumor suppressor 1 homolog [Palaemon carinicauda]|uniref:microtubule-associated tumor suppressor 1 homolog n=1 Tax=Palaemon carinicauda TaxID=392227 RepID=UPI0035B690BD
MELSRKVEKETFHTDEREAIKIQEENEARIKREDKLEEEIEELKAETQGLSNRIETLQKEKEIEIEKFSTKLQHLQKSSDRLKEELFNKDASIGEYLNRLSEMGQKNLEMSEQLGRARDIKVTFIYQLESVFEEETEELKETIEEQLGINREMKTEKDSLEMSLTEARISDLVRNGRYNCLTSSLQLCKTCGGLGRGIKKPSVDLVK